MDGIRLTRMVVGASFLFSVTLAWGAQAITKFRFPIADKDRKYIARFPIFGVDHNPKDHFFDAICTNYKGWSFPLCYDGHRGTDFMLRGGFRRMDRGSAEVVAAAAGEVIQVVDGNYDRCRINFFKFKVTCKGHPMRSNLVKLRHSDGTSTRYLHLKKGTVVVKVGQYVQCGQKLGLVGSSGYSSAPHLHFEVIDEYGTHFDPYAGRKSQEQSYWVKQKAKRGLPSGSCQ